MAVNPDYTTAAAADHSGHPVAVLAVACGATFLAFVNVAVVNFAFPAIASNFPDVGQSTLTWAVSGYAIAFAAWLAAGARLADMCNHRRVLTAGVTGFAAASLLCTLAPTVGWLITGRVLQGIAAAALLPTALGAMLTTVQPQKVAAAIGAWSATGALAAAVGPTAAALLVEWLGWRSIFTINLPVCAVLAIAVRRTVPATRTAARGVPDLFGALLLTGGIAAVVAAVTNMHAWGVASLVTVIVGVCGVLVIAAVVVRGYLHPYPTLQVRLCSSRAFAAANVVSAAFGFGLFAYLLAAPIWLIRVWGLTLVQAAGCVGMAAVVAMIAAATTGRHVHAGNAHWFGTAGMAALAGGFAVVASELFGPRCNRPLWVVLAVVLGTGIGLAVTALSVIIADSVPSSGFAAGIGLTMTACHIGGALGVAVLASLLADHDFLSSFHRLFTVLAVVSAAGAGLAALLSRRIPETTPARSGRGMNQPRTRRL
ncbi:MFS transporter [Nocardia asiatica]|uniref:MFS transporter n=1 Tax=Nocardia asiatica TaxID=209252 RepID=UPI00068710B7|nr:MFS transporter [Nocardia asiatica]